LPKMIVSIDGVVIKEVQLTKDRTTLGRRPYNDIVIDNLAVSGEHAVLQMAGSGVYLEDLNSTNGTYVNGKAVKRQLLQNNDTVEIGKYKIKYMSEVSGASSEQGATSEGVAQAADAPQDGGTPARAPSKAVIKVVSGAAAGREVSLVKVVTTIGKPGVAVAAITRRAQGYLLSHVEGASRAAVNGQPIGDEPVPLKSGDTFELAGTQMQFIEE
jgi:pSer/pThr/pTyr-binding forkhead associated (FHA) protein